MSVAESKPEMPDLANNDSLDQLASSFGFQFQKYPLDFLRSPTDVAQRKLEELKLYGALRALQARREALGQTALAGTNPTPEEIKSYQPGQPSVLDLSAPVSATPPATGNPSIVNPSDTPAGQRLAQLEDAIRTNAPAVANLQRTFALHDAGVDEYRIAAARALGARADLYGNQAAIAGQRREAVQNVLDNPDLDPLLAAQVAQGKTVLHPQRVKVQHRDGSVGYYDATPNMSGGFDYTPAMDENGQALSAPQTTANNAPTALQKNAAFVARVMFNGEPDADKKAVDLLTRLKAKGPADAWAALTQSVAKMNYGRYARDPQMLYNKTAEMWRVARPMEPIPVNQPNPLPTSGAASAPGAPAASPATAAEEPIYAQARAAIAKGADRTAVQERLRRLGYDPGKL